ncbi:MarR family winged helix-turn-helix transcriptional regulator [Actinoplanes teichomyceticus]|uniref:MarR family transcriptional regulator n=1 Tax=Actinoplanes teichomyceticus TaxID=1867 RepID=A0A561VIL1_ACTTI|nr:MarR family transcriptional regulator [Actinoplanes teichomyceticus]TWG11449.1 MarR family transcriptional regulator [Actinoplanes teichomyceticus]GIF15737.1 MarR family transcriptional regulator [Actinoplanes teichomyceticus]
MTERWLDEIEMRAWVAFLDTSNLLQRRLDQQLREDGGLTQPQYELLTRLAEAPGQRMRMAELALALVASRSGLTYQVTQLEKAGLVRREACAGDDRGVLAALTEQGVQALRRAAPGHLRVVRENLIDLLDRDQLVTLADTLGRARTHLRTAGGDEPRRTGSS